MFITKLTTAIAVLLVCVATAGLGGRYCAGFATGQPGGQIDSKPKEATAQAKQPKAARQEPAQFHAQPVDVQPLSAGVLTLALRPTARHWPSTRRQAGGPPGELQLWDVPTRKIRVRMPEPAFHAAALPTAATAKFL